MFIQFELALNAGVSHSVDLYVPAHPKKKSVKVKITSAISTFNQLLIAATPPFRYKDWTRKAIFTFRLKSNH